MKTALTIGFFDGVHLGHQFLLKRLREKPHTTILTFSNHPKAFLNPPAPKELLPLSEKLSLLKRYADELIVLPFDQDMANTSFEQILDRFDLAYLLLGQGSVFGKERLGNEENVRRYAAQKNFIVEYIPKVLFENEPVSSSRIRRLLKVGDQQTANQLLS